MSFADKVKSIREDVWASETVSIRSIENDDDLWYAVVECRLLPEQEDYVNPAGLCRINTKKLIKLPLNTKYP